MLSEALAAVLRLVARGPHARIARGRTCCSAATSRRKRSGRAASGVAVSTHSSRKSGKRDGGGRGRCKCDYVVLC